MRTWGACVTVTAAVSLAVLGRPAQAEETYTLRLSNVAPEGSPWARELHAFSKRVETLSEGKLRIKWHLGGVTGDEVETLQRVQKGQLEGAVSGQVLCERIAPSMRVTRLPGVFQSRGEAADVMNRLQPMLEAEAHQAGFVLPLLAGLGPDLVFTRTPVRTLTELRAAKLWRWNLDDVGIATMREMKLNVVPLPLERAAQAFDDGKLDGFLAIPLTALTFQWLTQTRFVTDLRQGYLLGCMAISERAMARLPMLHQRALRQAAAWLGERLEETARRTDESLLSGAFKARGVTLVPVSESFRAEYFAAAEAAREPVAEKYVPRGLLDRVLRLLADYRAEHSDR
jgi:TRAP-type transport system periplasmic protein